MYSVMSSGVASQAERPEPCFELQCLLFARGCTTPEWLHKCNELSLQEEVQELAVSS